MGETTYQQLQRLGAAIRTERLARKLSQEDFGEACDIHRTYVGEIERGEVNVSFQNIARIARALRLRPSELFARAGL